ncbi:16250_t:CDS:2 [Funneliformis caledonium]|uniref:16250_t:CDS:1 n=1 Tax=Funneliformis caledonium TaxID=1117310 RepID=A0A9N9GF55_9GLOM|nr:16250_t:CDS:2 [Funneliformis caledonium]
MRNLTNEDQEVEFRAVLSNSLLARMFQDNINYADEDNVTKLFITGCPTHIDDNFVYIKYCLLLVGSHYYMVFKDCDHYSIHQEDAKKLESGFYKYFLTLPHSLYISILIKFKDKYVDVLHTVLLIRALHKLALTRFFAHFNPAFVVTPQPFVS